MDEPGRRVELDVREPEHLAFLGAEPAKQRAQPGEQLVERERLHDVVVGARVETGDPVGDLVPRGQHQDRAASCPSGECAGRPRARPAAASRRRERPHRRRRRPAGRPPPGRRRPARRRSPRAGGRGGASPGRRVRRRRRGSSWRHCAYGRERQPKNGDHSIEGSSLERGRYLDQGMDERAKPNYNVKGKGRGVAGSCGARPKRPHLGRARRPIFLGAQAERDPRERIPIRAQRPLKGRFAPGLSGRTSRYGVHSSPPVSQPTRAYGETRSATRSTSARSSAVSSPLTSRSATRLP